MKAIVMNTFGGREVLALEEVAKPSPGVGEVLVEVRAVSVNRFLDVAVREGSYHVQPQLPHILGSDAAGVIAAVGDGVASPLVGQRVAVVSHVRCGKCEACTGSRPGTRCSAPFFMGVNRPGSYAEYVCVPVAMVHPIPPHLSFEDATVILRHFPAAFNLLESRAALKAGEWLLVMGAAGGLGSALIQVGKLMGARVIAAAGTDVRVQSCLEHGADFGINYRSQDLEKEVMRLSAGVGASVVCDSIAEAGLWHGSFNSLAFGGRLVTAGAGGGGKVELDIKRLYGRGLQIIGFAGQKDTDISKALSEAAAGRIHAVIGRRIPLSEVRIAHELVETNSVTGKVVLTKNEDDQP